MRRCPNCGSEQPDNSKFCSNCGRPIEDDPFASGNEFNFGSNDVNYGFNPPPFTPQPVSITLGINKANKHAKEAFSMALLVLIGSLLGFIFNIADLADVQELQEILPFVLDEYYGMFSTAINAYYAGIVFLALLIAASVVYVVFGAQLKKFNFPVYDDDVFDVAKKTFYASIVATVILGVVCIVEFIAVLNIIKMQRTLDLDLDTTTSVALTIKDFIIFGCTLASSIHTLKLSKCRQD